MKIPLKQVVFPVILVGFVFSLVFISFFGSKTKTEDNTAPFFRKPDSQLPIRIKIPAINIEAKVEYVGLNSEGKVDVPTGPDNAAWFELGTRPGELGSSVITGHAGYKDNKPAVFDDLDKLKRGDKVYIEDTSGETITFVVRELKSYGRDESVPDVFSVNDELSHLNLVTCTGDWDLEARTHSKRLVVFTDRE